MLNFNIINSNKLTLEEAATDVSRKLSEIKNVVKITAFISGSSESDLLVNKEIIDQAWSRINPTSKLKIHSIAQKSLNNRLSIEYISYAGNGNIHIHKNEEVEVVEIIDKARRMILLNGISDEKNKSIKEQSKGIFNKSEKILAHYNYNYKHIVRQWNYIPEILTTRNGLQNYQIFNDVRSQTYDAVLWPDGYPAATGIGVMGSHMTVDLMAVDGYEIKSISNPGQIDAHEYSRKVLEHGCSETRTTPKFERAKLFKAKGEFPLFISGTAAIAGEDSYSTTVEQQTKLTLQHINSLCQLVIQKNDDEVLSYEIQLLRVYIKHASDHQIVESICRKLQPTASIICVQADVCRNELLVEIEAFAKMKLRDIS